MSNLLNLPDLPDLPGLANKLKKGIDSAKNEIDSVAEGIKKRIEDESGISGLIKIVDELKMELESLTDIANLQKIIDNIKKQGETVGEEYLKTKLSIIEEFGFVTVPDLNIDFKGNKEITLELYIYCVYNDLGEVDDKSKSHLILSSNLSYDIFQPFNIEKVIENAEIKLKFNDDSVRQAIENKIQAEKDKLLSLFIKEFLSDYINIFSVIKNIVGVIK